MAVQRVHGAPVSERLAPLGRKRHSTGGPRCPALRCRDLGSRPSPKREAWARSIIPTSVKAVPTVRPNATAMAVDLGLQLGKREPIGVERRGGNGRAPGTAEPVNAHRRTESELRASQNCFSFNQLNMTRGQSGSLFGAGFRVDSGITSIGGFRDHIYRSMRGGMSSAALPATAGSNDSRGAGAPGSTSPGSARSPLASRASSAATTSASRREAATQPDS